MIIFKKILSNGIERELEPPQNAEKTVWLSEDFCFNAFHTFPSLYRECNDVRTRKISEIETAIDALERQKSHEVRNTGIEPMLRLWESRILPLN